MASKADGLGTSSGGALRGRVTQQRQKRRRLPATEVQRQRGGTREGKGEGRPPPTYKARQKILATARLVGRMARARSNRANVKGWMQGELLQRIGVDAEKVGGSRAAH